MNSLLVSHSKHLDTRKKPHKPQGRFNVDWDIFVKIFRNVFKLKNLVVVPEKLIDGSERQYPQNKTKI